VISSHPSFSSDRGYFGSRGRPGTASFFLNG
jgi:hypothetical protein